MHNKNLHGNHISLEVEQMGEIELVICEKVFALSGKDGHMWTLGTYIKYKA